MELRDFCILLADNAATVFATIPRATPLPDEAVTTHHKAVTFVVGDDVARTMVESVAALMHCMHGGMHEPHRLVGLVPFTRGHVDGMFLLVDRRADGLQVCVASAGLPRVELAVAFATVDRPDEQQAALAEATRDQGERFIEANKDRDRDQEP